MYFPHGVCQSSICTVSQLEAILERNWFVQESDNSGFWNWSTSIVTLKVQHLVTIWNIISTGQKLGPQVLQQVVILQIAGCIGEAYPEALSGWTCKCLRSWICRFVRWCQFSQKASSRGLHYHHIFHGF